MTVSRLKELGAIALDYSALKALIVGKTFKIRNNVTNQEFETLYGKDGRRLITRLTATAENRGRCGTSGAAVNQDCRRLMRSRMHGS